MNETGIVVKISGEDATVQFERKSACGKCGMCFGSDNLKNMELTLKNDIGAGVGDAVRVSSDSAKILKSLLIVYGIPLLWMGVGLVVAHFSFHNDIVTGITGLVSLIVGFLVLKLIDSKIGKSRRAILPKIISIEKSAKADNSVKED